MLRRLSIWRLFMQIIQTEIAAQLRRARQMWGQLSRKQVSALRELTKSHGFSVSSGDLLLLDGSWYVSHTGLLHLARRNRCHGIHVRPAEPLPRDISPQSHPLQSTMRF